MGLMDFAADMAGSLVSKKKILEQQNYWNSPEAEEKAKSITTDLVQAAIDAALGKQDSPPNRHFDFDFPVAQPRRITSPYGDRTLIIDGKKVKRFHIGIDIGGVNKVKAPEQVVVKKILELDKKYPCRFVKDAKLGWIDGVHSGKIPEGRAWSPYIIAVGAHTRTKYKFTHCTAERGLKVGDDLDFAEFFCTSGNFGYSQGPHLHTENWLYVETPKKSKYEGEVTHWPEPMNPVKYYAQYGITI